jgi:hypothetical protein
LREATAFAAIVTGARTSAGPGIPDIHADTGRSPDQRGVKGVQAVPDGVRPPRQGPDVELGVLLADAHVASRQVGDDAPAPECQREEKIRQEGEQGANRGTL